MPVIRPSHRDTGSTPHPPVADVIDEAEEEALRAEALAARARARANALRQEQRSEITTPSTISEDTSQSPSVTTLSTRGSVSRSDVDVSELPAVTPARSRRRRPRTLTLATAAITCCTAVLLASSATMIRHHRDIVRDREQASAFIAAAQHAVTTLMSISTERAKEDVQHILEISTGQFRDDFRSAADEFIKAAQSAKVTIKTGVQAAAVEKMTPDEADVAVAATSTLTDDSGKTQPPRSWRLAVKLAKESGQIKMVSMEFIP